MLELTAYNIWKQVIDASKEFRLSAKKKKINFHLDLSALLTDNGEMPSALDPESLDVIKFPNDMARHVVIADSLRISQVIRNLVSNAIKFTKESGNITIRGSWEQPQTSKKSPTPKKYSLSKGEEILVERNGCVKIDVVDDGVGMSKEQVENLFRAFIQFNVNELQCGEGSGLGLYITKGIVRQHNGELSVSSEGIGHGTTFTLKLPLYRILSDRVFPDSISGASYDNNETKCCPEVLPTCEQINEEPCELRVLVVDDVATNRKLLSRLIQNHGHVTDEAKDGQEAVAKVRSAMERGIRYDSILMDYEMPVMKGPEAAKEIRTLGCDSFLVGITGNVLADDVSFFMSCGANAVLPKPVNMKQLDMLWNENGVIDGTAFNK